MPLAYTRSADSSVISSFGCRLPPRLLARITTRAMLIMSNHNPHHLQSNPRGAPMADQFSQSDLCVLPTQVWSSLATELKAHAVWLLAQLAFNLVTAQTEPTTKEALDVTVSSYICQNPPRSSRPAGPHLHPPINHDAGP